MNRKDDLKNLWAELNSISEAKKEDDAENVEEPAEPKEALELDALLSRLEDVVSRLEEALGKKEVDKEELDDEDEPKKEQYVPRRVRRSMRDR